MIKARTVFDGEADKRAYVLSCEAGYEAALDGAVRRVLAIPDCRTVLLSGPTCSGKTTTAKKLITEFSEAGARVRVVSIDDFFYDRALLIERAVATGGRIDFDSPSTIDMEALAEAVDDILSGRPARLPRFDFLSGRRCETVTVPHGEHDVYIFEGIQAIYPTVTALFAGHRCASVFAFAERGIALADTAFDRTELRLLRRLVRDYNFRGADPTFTLDLWESVRENEEKHITEHLRGARLKREMEVRTEPIHSPKLLTEFLADKLGGERAKSDPLGYTLSVKAENQVSEGVFIIEISAIRAGLNSGKNDLGGA